MKPTVLVLGVLALALAGCTDPPAPDYGKVVDTQTYDDDIGAGDRAVYNVTLAAAGGIAYDLFVRDGKMELTIMPASEQEHYKAGDEVRTSAEESGSNLQNVRGFSAGEYALGVKCKNVFQGCPYNLVIKILRKETPP